MLNTGHNKNEVKKNHFQFILNQINKNLKFLKNLKYMNKLKKV